MADILTINTIRFKSQVKAKGQNVFDAICIKYHNLECLQSVLICLY